jgi:putative DNA primase/helicase
MSNTSIEEAKIKLPLRSLLEQLGLRASAKNSARCLFYNNGHPARCEQRFTPKLEFGNGSTNINNTNEEAIAKLAALPSLEYERQREPQANKLGCRLATLDRLVEAGRAKGNGVLQGSAVVLPGIELWPESVDGAQTLDDIAGTFREYVALPPGAANALALWCAHTHLFEAFICSPRLNITSPERGCGKSTLRDVVALFVPRPVLTENLSVAVLFRLVDAHAPVILADEYDAWLDDNEELRGLLNAGHRRGASVYRCEGDRHEVRAFRAYTPAVLCGIGSLPGTLHDRSIVLRLDRAKPGELSVRFDPRHTESEVEHCRKLARWCADNRGRIQEIDPALPNGVFNRLADNWRPLFAIAEAAGEDWPKRCADAFAKLSSQNDADSESLRVNLLADIRQIFTSERMFSKDVIDALKEMAERPWSEVSRGKPITERWLARNLAGFGIHSKTLRIVDERAKGYEVADFSEAFERYLPRDEKDSIRDSVTNEGESDSAIRDKSENVTDAEIPF